MSWKVFFHYYIPAIAVLVSAQAPPLSVNTSIGIFQGFTNTTSGYEAWLGVPFAQPPVGNLRFRATAPITSRFKGVQSATAFGSACPQPVSSHTAGVTIAEDCLFLNVFRPQNATSNSKLPVLVWFHGGTYHTGTASDPLFRPTFIFQRAAALGKPIMFVSVNYRLNAFGFLASAFIDPKDLDNGLQDQRQALRFIKSEIAAFGGDPTKVTIWGQSAGAGSVEAHVLFPAEEPLFRAGILDSATGPFKSSPFPAQFDEPGKTFARFSSMVGCPPPSPAAVECVRDAPFETLLNASNFLINTVLNSQPWEPTPGGPDCFVPERGSKQIASGNYLRVPLLWGTNLNEGTSFSTSLLGLPQMSATAENARFDQFIGDLILDNRTLTTDVLDEIHRLYPINDTSLGGRFNTGDSLFDRAAAWYGDNMFLAARRLFFNKAATTQQLRAYFFNEFIPGNNPTLGVAHASELPLIFGGFPASETPLAEAFTDAYVNFVSELDPGSFWPPYNLQEKPVLQWMSGNITVIKDDFFLEKTEFLDTPKVLNEFEK